MLCKLVILCVLAVASAEVVRFGKCNNYQNINCTIKEVRINPCPEAETEKPCSIKRGKSAHVEFDFTPTGSYGDLETRAYWASPTGDLPWIGMDTDGCKHTACPTEPTQQTFSYDLNIDKKFPSNFSCQVALMERRGDAVLLFDLNQTDKITVHATHFPIADYLKITSPAYE